MSDLVAKQLRYWNEFRAHVRCNGDQFDCLPRPNETTANELLVNIGGGVGVELRAWMDRRDGFIAVSLYLTGARKHDAYRSLEMKRSAIDAALGDEVSEWRQPGAGRPAGYVALMRRNADPMDESDWETQFVWLQEKLERFDAVFRPIVKRL